MYYFDGRNDLYHMIALRCHQTLPICWTDCCHGIKIGRGVYNFSYSKFHWHHFCFKRNVYLSSFVLLLLHTSFYNEESNGDGLILWVFLSHFVSGEYVQCQSIRRHTRFVQNAIDLWFMFWNVCDVNVADKLVKAE